MAIDTSHCDKIHVPYLSCHFLDGYGSFTRIIGSFSDPNLISFKMLSKEETPKSLTSGTITWSVACVNIPAPNQSRGHTDPYLILLDLLQYLRKKRSQSVKLQEICLRIWQQVMNFEKIL